MSEILEFRWPEGVPGTEHVLLSGDEAEVPGWALPDADGDDAGDDEPPAEASGEDDDDLYLYVRVDRTAALRRVEELERAYAGALSVIDAQRRRLLALQRQLERAEGRPGRRRSR